MVLCRIREIPPPEPPELPLIMIPATPMSLLGAAIVRQGYFEAVKNGYRKAFEFSKSVFEVMPSL